MTTTGWRDSAPPLFPVCEATRGHYQRAYRCLDAAAELMYDVRSTLDSNALEEKLSKRARGILDRG